MGGQEKGSGPGLCGWPWCPTFRQDRLACLLDGPRRSVPLGTGPGGFMQWLLLRAWLLPCCMCVWGPSLGALAPVPRSATLLSLVQVAGGPAAGPEPHARGGGRGSQGPGGGLEGGAGQAAADLLPDAAALSRGPGGVRCPAGDVPADQREPGE